MSYVECMVLGLLNEGYRYGYELDKVLEERHMRYWAKLSRKSIYLALQRMTKKGWVEADTRKEGEMPVQTVYSLTSAGKERLEEMVAEGLGSQELVKFENSIPMAFLYILPPDEAIARLRLRREWLSQFVEQIPSQELDRNPEIRLGKRANIRLLRAHYEMEIEWLDWVVSELAKEKNRRDKGEEE